jgi:tRNA(fMet)-specific endonuclease VapC
VKYILDTNTLSFLMRGDPSVTRQLVARSRTDVLLPQPVVAEIEYGLSRLPRSRKRDGLRKHFDLFLEELRRAEWTDEVSRAFGRAKAGLERQGVRIEDFDVAVAAHALAYEGILVTDNVEHMSRVKGLEIDNWQSRME